MNEFPSKTPTGKITFPFVYLSSVYFLSVGILYLWGYWIAFEINILEYANLTDILKTTAYPIASVFVFFATGAIIGELIFPNTLLPIVGVPNLKAAQLIKMISPFIAAAYVVGTVLLWLLGPVEKWNILPLLIAIPAYFVARRWEFLASLISNERTRSLLIFLLVALPGYSFGHGRLKATKILQGTAYVYSEGAVDGIAVPADARPEGKPRYLGQASDYLFFYIPARKTVFVTKFDNVKSLELRTIRSQL